MKIGVFVQRVASAPGFEQVISAHVQLPLFSIELLREVGHSVHLITTKYSGDKTLPAILPKNLKTHLVDYGIRQGDDPVMEVGNRSGVRPKHLVKQIRRLKEICDTEEYDILHFYGSQRIGYLASLLKLSGVKNPIVLTINSGRISNRFGFAQRWSWRQISCISTSTNYFSQELAKHSLKSWVIRHGISSDIVSEISSMRNQTEPFRVLFWRDPSHENGADICLGVYELLAEKFPDVSFNLAIRPHWNPVSGIDRLCEKYSNIEVYKFPYPSDISISRLIAESICVFLPFRSLSTHPQYAVLESLISGATVVTTDIASNRELIQSGKSGYLIPVDDIPRSASQIEYLLENRESSIAIGDNASGMTDAIWNWNSYIPDLIDIYSDVLARSG